MLCPRSRVVVPSIPPSAVRDSARLFCSLVSLVVVTRKVRKLSPSLLPLQASDSRVSRAREEAKFKPEVEIESEFILG